MVKSKKIAFNIPVVIEPDDDGFLAHIPNWTDVYAPGDTVEEALVNLFGTAVAVGLSYLKHKDTIPLLESKQNGKEQA